MNANATNNSFAAYGCYSCLFGFYIYDLFLIILFPNLSNNLFNFCFALRSIRKFAPYSRFLSP